MPRLRATRLTAIAAAARRVVASWSPLSLFAAGEQGGWYDPTDLTTMFQDSAGTTPVTAVEQPVGRWLDKSGRGNHLIQPTSASRPTYSKRYNLLERTQEFDNAAWVKNAGSVSANAATAPDGTSTADKLVENTASTTHEVKQDVTTTAVSHTFSVFLKAAERTFAMLYHGNTNSAQVINLTTGAAAGNAGLGSPVSSAIENSGNGWWKVSITVNATAAVNNFRVYPLTNSTTHNYTGDGASGILIWGADLRRTIHTQMGMPAYQRVTTATDYDETGFLPRLRFDGADDSMYSAASVDFSASDAMTIMAGVAKLSDAALGMLLELSANLSLNSGVFWLLAPLNTGASGDFDFSFKGTNQIQVNSGTRTAPALTVLTATDDISSDAAVLRYNGVQVATSSGDQGTGNFGNHVLYVGRRNNANLPFNGDIFQLIIRGALTSGATLTSAEQYVAARTGVTL